LGEGLQKILLYLKDLPPPFVCIQEARYPAGYRFPRHRHGFYQLIHVLDGSGEVLDSGARPATQAPCGNGPIDSHPHPTLNSSL
jgi:hypothetical protein